MTFLRLTKLDPATGEEIRIFYLNSAEIDSFSLQEIVTDKGKKIVTLITTGAQYADVLVEEDLRQFLDIRVQMDETEAREKGYIK